MRLVKTSLNINKTKHLAVKLHQKFITAIADIYHHKTRDDFTYFKMGYNTILKNDHLKIKNIVEKHLDTFEIVFAPVYKHLDKIKYEKCVCIPV